MIKLIWRRLDAHYYTEEGVAVNPPWEIDFDELYAKFGETKTEVSLEGLFPLTSMQECLENCKECGRTPKFDFAFDENLVKWKNLAIDKSPGAVEVWIPDSYGTEDFSLQFPKTAKMAWLNGQWNESYADMVAEMWAYRYAYDLIYAPHRGSDRKGFGG